MKDLLSEKIRRSEAVRSDRLEKANSSDKEFANPAMRAVIMPPKPRACKLFLVVMLNSFSHMSDSYTVYLLMIYQFRRIPN